ncbi:MAG TPA: sugar phosphate isomerase/epimerase family protein [Terracidiphilus sp.]|jgi:sugar phosphate isomerase/epimerase
MTIHNRRTFLIWSAAAAAVYGLPGFAQNARGAFRVAVITDEISPDFDHACHIASQEFGMHWVELRSMWGKNLMDVTSDQITEAQKILQKYKLQVTDIASPLFKTDWPGAPRSTYGSKGDMHGAAETTFKQQDEILEKSIALAKQFKTEKVRCFDFWRLDDVTPYRAAIDDKLREAAEKSGKAGILLVLENEFECNTATGREAARTLGAIKSPSLALNWDPANAVMRGEMDAYPAAWEMLPKNRIHHCHVKNAVKDDTGKVVWSPTGSGVIDWAAQFRALKGAGYRDAVSLETHWHGAATPEESSRESWAGMKKALADADAA